jgi:hypothetical protein
VLRTLAVVAAGAAQGVSAQGGAAQAVRLEADLPRVMVFLDEEGDAATARFTSFLREAGFTVLDPAFARTAADRDLARQAVAGDDGAATALGRSLGAHVLVLGAAPSDAQPSPAAANLAVGTASVAVRALRLDEPRVVSEQTAAGRGLDATVQAARAKAVGQAVEEILYRTGFMGDLLIDWEEHPWEDGAYWEPSPGSLGAAAGAREGTSGGYAAPRIAILESDAYPEPEGGPATRSIEIVAAERRIARVRGVVTGAASEVTVGPVAAAARPLTAQEADALGIGAGTSFEASVPLGPDDTRVRVRARGAAGETSIEVIPEIGRRWAVVVGISKYADGRITPLSYADDDARAMADFLRSPAGGSVPESSLRVLLDEAATAEALRDALFVFLQQAAPEDMVTVYVASHGSPDPKRPSNLYILTHDTDVDAMAATAFPMWDVKTALRRQIASERVVVIADACRSAGTLVDEANPVGGAFSELFDPSRRLTLSAAGTAQVSFEDAKWGGGHGVFTHFLLEGFGGAADADGNGVVTFREAAAYVSGKVKDATAGSQIPEWSGMGDVPLALVGGGER